MRTRTRLTTPPGHDPSLSEEERPENETYVGGLALPEEPRVPGRRRRLWVALTLLAVVAIGAYVTFRVATSGQTFDPALDPGFAPDEAATSSVDPDPTGTMPGEG